MNVGLRIDVDTFRGTRLGVPNLCRILKKHGVRGTFFFSVGPDNMGRHLWRLLRPAFLWKMLRTRAASLYGWDILLRGTFWPGPVIGKKLPQIIRDTADAGHEVGLHAWDHHAWQAHADTMTQDDYYRELRKGYDLLADILEKPPTCYAVPGWKCNEQVLMEKEKFPFRYNSDCRGHSVFLPLAQGKLLSQPQVPVTLPTYDEVIGRNGVCDENYNDHILSLIKPGSLNVLTIHAEVEGIVCLQIFDEFLCKAASKGISFSPLGDWVTSPTNIECGEIQKQNLAGREGWVCFQSFAKANHPAQQKELIR